MCIYYQDEFGICCLKTENIWDFETHVKCIEDKELGKCSEKITMKQAIDSVKKVENITKVVLDNSWIKTELGGRETYEDMLEALDIEE